MYFVPEVHEKDFLSLLEKFIRITGAEPWEKKFLWFRNELIANSYIREWLQERHGMEAKLHELLMKERETGRFPLEIQDIYQYRLYGFVTAVARIYDGLSMPGRVRLRGMLLDGLKSTNGLVSLQHEMATAIHLMSRGFDVEFYDMENGSGVDFIARRNGIEIEIECKVFTCDIGRKIHKRHVFALYKALESTVKPIYQAATKGLLIRVKLPDRLTSNTTQHKEIICAVSKAVVHGANVTSSSTCSVEVKDFELASSPFMCSTHAMLTRKTVADFVEDQFGIADQNMMLLFSPQKRALLISVESEGDDATLKGIYRQLRESAKGQFSKVRPGMLAVQFLDLTSSELLELGQLDTSNPLKATGLQLMTSNFLYSQNRNHIHSVVYRSHGELGTVGGESVSITEREHTYFFLNHNNWACSDSRYDLFS